MSSFPAPAPPCMCCRIPVHPPIYGTDGKIHGGVEVRPQRWLCDECTRDANAAWGRANRVVGQRRRPK